MTRAYKRTLNRAQRKAFRSRMWEFRRRPAELSAEEKGRLDELLRRLPRLKTLYDLRVENEVVVVGEGSTQYAGLKQIGNYLDHHEMGHNNRS